MKDNAELTDLVCRIVDGELKIDSAEVKDFMSRHPDVSLATVQQELGVAEALSGLVRDFDDVSESAQVAEGDRELVARSQRVPSRISWRMPALVAAMLTAAFVAVFAFGGDDLPTNGNLSQDFEAAWQMVDDQAIVTWNHPLPRGGSYFLELLQAPGQPLGLEASTQSMAWGLPASWMAELRDRGVAIVAIEARDVDQLPTARSALELQWPN